MLETRTNNLTDITGCIEDRTFRGAEDGELNQLPGADLYFSYLRDVLAVLKDETPTHRTLEETVLSDVASMGADYTVHNDADNGTEFDGCGFAAQIEKISTDLSSNINEVLSTLGLTDFQKSRARQLADAVGRLSVNADYFVSTGGQLVEAAAKAGASLITYVGDHTAKQLTVDRGKSSTYDSANANAAHNDLNPAFNVDTNRARERADNFGLDSDDAEIFAEILSMSTVRVLSGGAITEASYVTVGETAKAQAV